MPLGLWEISSIELNNAFMSEHKGNFVNNGQFVAMFIKKFVSETDFLK